MTVKRPRFGHYPESAYFDMGWDKGLEAGVAEGRRQGREIVEKLVYENTEGKWYVLAPAYHDLSDTVSAFMADTPPEESPK